MTTPDSSAIPPKIEEVAPPPITPLPALRQVSQTRLATGDLVRLKSGGPLMTLGPVVATHTDNNQVECRWSSLGKLHANFFTLGALELVSEEDAKLQVQKDAESSQIAEQRRHELELAKIAAMPATLEAQRQLILAQKAK